MDILQDNKPGAKLQGWLNIDFLSSHLLLLYIFTMPFISAFSFTGTLSMPLVISVILIMLMGLEIIRTGSLPGGFVGFDLVILLFFLILVVFSFYINGWGNSKSLNHTIGYGSTFLLFYITIKYTFFNIKDKSWLFKRTLQYITCITVMSAVYANFEFISSNFFDLNLNEYIPRPSEEEKYYDASVVGLFYRARGFSPESGHFTFMMELFIPLTIYYMYFSGFCKWAILAKALIIIVIVFSLIFAASSATFVIVPVSVLLAIFIHIKRVFFYIKRQPGKILLVSAVVSFICIVFNYVFSFYTFLLLSINDKVGSSSFDDRLERIDFFYDKFPRLDLIKELTGVGPAGFNILGLDESKSILSLYYSLTFELGFVGLSLILLLFLYIFLHALKINTKIGFFLLVSVISGVIHYYFIANFWYPWFWFIAAFTIFCSKKLSNG